MHPVKYRYSGEVFAVDYDGERALVFKHKLASLLGLTKHLTAENARQRRDLNIARREITKLKRLVQSKTKESM